LHSSWLRELTGGETNLVCVHNWEHKLSQVDRRMVIPKIVPKHTPFDHQQLVTRRRVDLHQMLDPCLSFIWGVVDLSLDYERSLHHQISYLESNVIDFKSRYAQTPQDIPYDHRVIWFQGNDFADSKTNMEDHQAFLCGPITNDQCISYIQQTHSTCKWHDRLFPSTREIDLVIEQVQLVSHIPPPCKTCKSYHVLSEKKEKESENEQQSTLVPFRLTSRLQPTTPITMLISYSAELGTASG
jgi:hypothetical protein